MPLPDDGVDVEIRPRKKKSNKIEIMNSEKITLEKETAEQLLLLIKNLIGGKKPHFKKQISAVKVLESKLV